METELQILYNAKHSGPVAIVVHQEMETDLVLDVVPGGPRCTAMTGIRNPERADSGSSRGGRERLTA